MTALTDWLDAAKARADAATDGPWTVSRKTQYSDVHVTTSAVDPELAEPKFIAATGDPHYDGTLPDAEFIAASRTDLPKALEALRAVQAYLDDLDHQFAGDVIPAAHVVYDIERVVATALGVTP